MIVQSKPQNQVTGHLLGSEYEPETREHWVIVNRIVPLFLRVVVVSVYGKMFKYLHSIAYHTNTKHKYRFGFTLLMRVWQQKSLQRRNDKKSQAFSC